MKLWGKEYTREEIRKYIGDISQIAGAKEYVLTDGRANGVKAIDIKTGSGLCFTVLPDRCMDIAWADHNGQSLTHITKTGIVSSKYYECENDQWFRSYFAGLLTTCGLRNTGAQCVDDGENFGLHGRISNIPAEKVNIQEIWKDDELYISVSGIMREAVFYGENLTLKRTISVQAGKPEIIINDIVENNGFRDEPLFILYHTNYGFPLISGNSRLSAEIESTGCFDSAAEEGLERVLEFDAPTHEYYRQVFMHKLKKEKNGFSKIAITNPDLKGFNGVELSFDLPELFQFKMFGETDYQLGLEPSNCMPMGRAPEREMGRVRYLKAGSKQEFTLKFTIIEDPD